MHLNSRLLIQQYAKEYFTNGVRVLEIGPDTFPSSIEKICRDETMIWHTLDINDDTRLTYYKNVEEYGFPIENGQYDIVISANVIEHVKKIWRWMKEISRVTKKGGYVITVNPVSWPYHAYPVDCWRIYPDGIAALYDDADLSVLFSKFENLESQFLLGRSYDESKMWPGASLEGNLKIKKLKNSLGYPVPAALDTITIGQKK